MSLGNWKAYLFDLDDTLYDEIDFIHSGYRAASRYLSMKCPEADFQVAYDYMRGLLETQGRAGVFEKTLALFNLPYPNLVSSLLRVYRKHRPSIQMTMDDDLVLDRLMFREGKRIGIVTDGDREVQENKVYALNILRHSGAIILTDDLGPGNGKPSPEGYAIALTELDVKPSDAVYVGNNPTKDFLGARSLGMATVQIDRPRRMVKYDVPDKRLRADFQIADLRELL